MEVRRLTGGRGVDVVYDSVGKTTFEKSLNALRPRGTLALFGQSSGPVPPFDPGILNTKGSLFLTRPSLGHLPADARGTAVARRRGAGLRSTPGKLRVRIDRTYPLADAAAAHRDLESRKTAGKLVLVIGSDMTLQTKVTLGSVLLATVIVTVVSSVDLGSFMRSRAASHRGARRGHQGCGQVGGDRDAESPPRRAAARSPARSGAQAKAGESAGLAEWRHLD